MSAFDPQELSPKIRKLVARAETMLKEREKPVWMPTEFNAMLRSLSPKGTRLRTIEEALEQMGLIQYKTVKSDNYTDVARIYIPSLHPTAYHYAISLRGNAYLSHSSAVHLLGLTQQQPKTIYVNKEQSKKPPPEGELSQEAIDRAFSRPQRRSNYVFRVEDTQIVLLSGKATGNAGVIADAQTGLPLTCLERTLIDITVRPRYAGGVFQVSQAFRTALKEIHFSHLLSLLDTLDYRYPYHQSIGFYLQKAGASEQTLQKLRRLGQKYDFYLDYAMAAPQYDKSWRIFYPLGI